MVAAAGITARVPVAGTGPSVASGGVLDSIPSSDAIQLSVVGAPLQITFGSARKPWIPGEQPSRQSSREARRVRVKEADRISA